MPTSMTVSTKYEFTALDSNDLIDKIRTRLELVGLTTEYASNNIIGGVTLGKRLHMKTASGLFLNFGSGLAKHPCDQFNTQWPAANAQAVCANISRTFSSSKMWHENETSDYYGVDCVNTENNCLTRIFTTSTSIAIVTNYSSIYYDTIYINFEGTNVFISSTAGLMTTPKDSRSFGRILIPSSYCRTELITSGSWYQKATSSTGTGVCNYEDSNIVPSYQSVYTRSYNLINKASAAFPMNAYIMRTGDTAVKFLKNPLDIAIINMKNTDAAFIFNTSGIQHQAFPDRFVDASSNQSMGLLFRIA